MSTTSLKGLFSKLSAVEESTWQFVTSAGAEVSVGTPLVHIGVNMTGGALWLKDGASGPTTKLTYGGAGIGASPPMEQILVVLLPFVIGISFGVWMLRWQYRTAETRLRRWAEQSAYTLIEKSNANPAGTGPMTRSTTSKQVVYRVVVATSTGMRRTALVRIGSPAVGVLSEELSVEWQDGSI